MDFGKAIVFARPRTYTPAFGKAVASLMPELLSSGEGKVEVSERSAEDLYASTPWTDWSEANFKDVIRYLRGNQSLCLPESWRAVLPVRL